MGFFDLFRKKREEPPDFSTSDFSQPNPSTPNFSQTQNTPDPLGIDQEAAIRDPFSTPSSQTGGQSTFDHEIFTPSNAETARQYAEQLKGTTSTVESGVLTGHEAQLILERLDTIKAELDAIKQRMIRVEQFMEKAEQKAGTRRYF